MWHVAVAVCIYSDDMYPHRCILDKGGPIKRYVDRGEEIGERLTVHEFLKGCRAAGRNGETESATPHSVRHHKRIEVSVRLFTSQQFPHHNTIAERERERERERVCVRECV